MEGEPFPARVEALEANTNQGWVVRTLVVFGPLVMHIVHSASLNQMMVVYRPTVDLNNSHVSAGPRPVRPAVVLGNKLVVVLAIVVEWELEGRMMLFAPAVDEDRTAELVLVQVRVQEQEPETPAAAGHSIAESAELVHTPAESDLTVFVAAAAEHMQMAAAMDIESVEVVSVVGIHAAEVPDVDQEVIAGQHIV